MQCFICTQKPAHLVRMPDTCRYPAAVSDLRLWVINYFNNKSGGSAEGKNKTQRYLMYSTRLRSPMAHGNGLMHDMHYNITLYPGKGKPGTSEALLCFGVICSEANRFGSNLFPLTNRLFVSLSLKPHHSWCWSNPPSGVKLLGRAYVEGLLLVHRQ